MSSSSDETPLQEGLSESLVQDDGSENPNMSYDQMQAEMRKLKQEIERKEQSLKQEIESRKQKLESRKQKLESRNQKLEELSLQIESRKQDLKKYSIERMLELYNGVPSMATNSCARQSTPGVGLSVSHHDPGTIEKAFFKGAEQLQETWSEFPLCFEDDEGVPFPPSLVEPSMMDRPGELHHYNEATVRFHVYDLLRDAIRCMGLCRQLQVFVEQSLFSLRPDLIVIRFQKSVVLVVKVQNPDSLLFNSDEVAGQMHDYCKCVQQMGNSHPFTVLSCYNQMCLVRLCQDDNDPTYGELMQKAWTNLCATRGRLAAIYEKDDGSTSTKAEVCPILDSMPQVGIPDYGHLKKRGRSDDSTSAHDSTTQMPPQDKVVYSDVFDTTKAFQAITYALACGMASVDHMGRDNALHTLMPREGETFKRPLATIKEENGFCFETHEMTFTVKGQPNLATLEKLHLHCVLGSGRSGKTLLGSTSTGIGLMVKLFLFSSTVIPKVAEEEWQEAWEKEEQQQRALIEEEASRWDLLYPHLNDFVATKKLNGIWCLTMPYVAPIQSNERQDYLKLVETELHRFAMAGFNYEERDLQWRHIGKVKRNGKVEIVLFDLESLVSIEPASGAGISACVDGQVNVLKRLADTEEQREPWADLIC